jgi:hypothetical protein
MADIVVVVPNSQQDTAVDSTKGDKLWIIFTDSFCWDPTDPGHGFDHKLLAKGVYGTSGQLTAFGPYPAKRASKVTFPDPSPPADCSKKPKKGEKPFSSPHSITIS